ncbi:MAG: hypothetical protein B7733_19420 [Myxococcales bacterium FL481]|nr:MAG: hypothetical protein B7733_19420 [Myxococcales bacterium FL481]
MASPTDPSPAPVAHNRVDLEPGRQLEVVAHKDGQLLIAHADGNTAARVEWVDGTARIIVERADLAIEQTDDVRVRCRNFRVDAEQDIRLTAGHELSAQAVRKARLEAEVVETVATLGDLLLRANDFVRACGERILLNTDKDPAESDRRAKEFLRRLLGK